MNKILNINLGGYALTIDDDAYEYLQAYLESIRRRFSESEGRDEIVGDIEARMGELITQNMGARTIVMLPDVEAAVIIMGKPEDFGGAAEDAEPQGAKSTGGTGGSSSSSTPFGNSIKTGKRLFRDEEEAVAGGVCSGLSAYFGIQDPLWMRLIFVLLVFMSFGFWVPTYILMWVLIPPAKTAADRLAMRGEPINVDNIAREIEEGFDKLSGKVNDYKSKGNSFGGQQALNSTVSTIGQIFAMMVRFVGKFAAVIAIIIVVSLFLGLGISWIGGIWGLFVAAPYVDYFSPYTNAVTWMGFANFFFLVGIPIVGLFVTFTRVVFKWRVPRWTAPGLGIVWFLNLVSMVLLVGFAAKDYRHKGMLSKTIDLNGLQSDTLRISGINLSDGSEEFSRWFDDGDISINGEKLNLRGNLDIRVFKSNADQFRVVQVVRARGRNNQQALEHAEQIGYNAYMSGNTLVVPTGFQLNRGNKWRGQEVRINIEVPVGKTIVFDENIYQHAAADTDLYTDSNDGYYISRGPDRYFKMTRDGLFCTSCPTFGSKEYSDYRDFDQFIFEGNLDVEIRQGEKFKINFEGGSNDVQKIQSGDKLTLIGPKTGAMKKVFIETPVFTSVMADNVGEVIIRGFDEGQASISARGNSRIKAYLDSDRLEVSLTGNSSLDLSGKGSRLEVNITDSANLEASNWRAEDAEVSAHDGARARIYVKDDAYVVSDGTSSVKVDGGAKVRNTRD